ncbi:ATP-binding cassette domain-containing protein [Actinomycetota bacterium Odt1-20B]
MTTSAIAVTGLRKAYGDKVVLDGIGFEVPAGAVFSMLGPNGAGKTTTVNVLTTLMKADSGTVRVAGHDAATATRQVRAAIGVTGQFAAVDELLSGRENLQLMADLKRVRGGQVVSGLLERFDLTESADKLAATYSGGMRRKLDLAMTLVGKPEIIFLDEPTTGLDPRSRRTMWQIVRELVAEGTTIFLTTQYLDEADQLADRIAVLNQGSLVAEGTPEELKRRIPGGHVRLRFTDPAAYRSAAAALREVTADDEALSLQIPSDGTQRELRSILDWLDSAGVEADELTVHTPDLDDVFLALTDHTATQPATAQPTAAQPATTQPTATQATTTTTGSTTSEEIAR